MSSLVEDFKSGFLSAGINSVDTSLSSSEFSVLQVVASPDTMKIVLDPQGIAGDPEIVTVTTHTASATTVTVTRGGNARSHSSNTRWVHAATAADFQRIGFEGAASFESADINSLTVNSAFTLPTTDGSADQVLSTDGAGTVSWVGVTGMPVGALIPYAGTTSPDTNLYLLCDGAAVSRTTYATLFAVIGTSFGVGDGSTTFNVPDLRGRIPMGLDNLGGTPANRVTDANADALGGTVGAQDHTLTEAELPSHSHSQTSHTHSVDPPSTSVSFNQTIRRTGGYGLGGASTADAFGPYSGTTLTGTVNVSSFTSGFGGGGSTGGAGSGNAHSILQPVLSIGYLIQAA
jgi:microcystin-dependent protein